MYCNLEEYFKRIYDEYDTFKADNLGLFEAGWIDEEKLIESYIEETRELFDEKLECVKLLLEEDYLKKED